MHPHDFILTLLLLGSVAMAFTPAAAQTPALPDSTLDVPSGSDPALNVYHWQPGEYLPNPIPALPPPAPARPQGFTPPPTFTDVVQAEADYPPESFRLGEQGIVRLRFLLTETGEATGCTMESSSGYPRLDEAACGLVRRWKYEPSIDAGKATALFVTVNLMYSIPRPRPGIGGDPALDVPITSPRSALAITTDARLDGRYTPPEPVTSHAMTVDDYPADSIRMQEQGRIGLVFIVNEAGDVSECAVLTSSGYPRLDAAARAMVVNRWKYKPAILDGKATAIITTANVEYQLR